MSQRDIWGRIFQDLRTASTMTHPRVRACLSSVSNMAATTKKMGDRRSHWKLYWEKYLELSISLVVVAVLFFILKELYYLTKEERTNFQCDGWISNFPSPQYNVFAFFFARQDYFQALKCASFLCFVHTWLWITLFSGCFILCSGR